MDEAVFDFQSRIDSYEKSIENARDNYTTAYKRRIKLEMELEYRKLIYMHNHPGIKAAKEKIEEYVSVTEQEKADYCLLTGLRHQVEMYKVIMESLDGSRGSVQSQMKWWRETHAGSKSL